MALEHSCDERSAVGRERSRLGRVTPMGRSKQETPAIRVHRRRIVCPLMLFCYMQVIYRPTILSDLVDHLWVWSGPRPLAHHVILPCSISLILLEGLYSSHVATGAIASYMSNNYH